MTKPKAHPKIKRNSLAEYTTAVIVEARVFRKPPVKRGRKGNTSEALILATDIKINGEPVPSIPHVCLATRKNPSEFERVSNQLGIIPGVVQTRTFKAVAYSYGDNRYSLKVTT